MQTTVIVPDISQYDDNIETPIHVDFNKMKLAGAKGVIIRTGQGNWADRDFVANYKNSKGILPRGVYWFYDSRFSALSQALLFAKLLQYSGLPEMEVWCDYEEEYGGSFGGWKNFAVFVEELGKQLPTCKIGIYTGFYYWQDNSPNPTSESASYNWFAKYPLWIAAYGTDTPKIPAPWSNVLYWQYTDRGSGKDYGSEAADLDLNYFQGTEDEFNTRYNMGSVVDPPLDPTDNPKINPSIPVPNTPAVYMRVKDDNEVGSARRAMRKPGLPSTVRIRGGNGVVRLTQSWLKYVQNLNSAKSYIYLFKDASGWHNNGDMNRVEQLTFSENIVKVNRIENGRAYIEHFHLTDTPPAPVRLTIDKLNTPVQLFTTQYKDCVDVSTDGRWPMICLIANDQIEDLYMDLVDLAPYQIVNIEVKVAVYALNVRAAPYSTAKPVSVKYSGNLAKVYGITPDNSGNIWGRLDFNTWMCLKFGNTYYTDWRG